MTGAARAATVALSLSMAAAGCTNSCSPGSGPGAAPSVQPGLNLEHRGTFKMPTGTHRPEILITEEGEVLLVVVKPEGAYGRQAQVKHQLYRYGGGWEQVGRRVPLTRTDQTYGEPADHRVAMINGELVMVYQALRWRTLPPLEGGGPAEDYARDQSLVLARFDLSGKELWRGPIVSRTADFSQDNFPDHCLLWHRGRLLVATGSRGLAMKIREVDLSTGKVLATHRFPTTAGTIPSSIGNSMVALEGGLAIFSSTAPGGQSSLALTYIDSSWRVKQAGFFANPSRGRLFPTASLLVEGKYMLVSHIAIPRGSVPHHLHNNFAPRLLILDSRLREVGDLRVGAGGGFGHVHPTMAIHGRRLLLAWSKMRPDGHRSVPQVHVEELTF